jgi:nucleoside-diphosphate-sugar epimerase
MIPEQFRLKTTIKYPTSLIIGGLSRLGLEIAESLIEQGGYVIIVDTYTEENIKKLHNFPPKTLVSFIDYSSIPDLDEELRRLDYIFFFCHEGVDYKTKVSTQEFLKFSNYLDATLSLASKFEGKFLLTTAIKAHQLILSNEDYGIGDDATIKHKIYREIEVQKYAESLVMEYVEKVQLDARITRLGEIIGEGIDFSVKNAFNDLILEATSNDVLHLKKDGLESEWYVHLLDAAYGIIKAQFTKETAGNIFSICYDVPYTHLSVAYKIQELEEGSKEIKFIDEKDNLPSIKLYKPAPNLSVAGWMPRISFEKAVKQSLAAAKIYLIESQSKNSNDPRGKLQNFLDLAGKSSPKSAHQDSISKLLADRKHHEQLRKERLALADSSMKSKRKYRPKTAREKFRTWSWDLVFSLGNTFSFLKYRSPAEFGLIMISFVLLVILYFTLLSPLLALTRNFLIILPEYNNLSEEINKGDYSNLSKRSQKLNKALKDSSKLLDGFSKPARLVAINKPIDELSDLLSDYAKFTEGTENIGYSLEPVYEYLDNFVNNTQVRTNDTNMLSVTDSGVNLEEYLSKAESRKAYLSLGITKINEANENLQTFDSGKLPSFFTKKILKTNSEIANNIDEFNSTKGLSYLPEILGTSESKTYLLLLLDNTRATPLGGELSSFALITLTKGSISEVILKPIDDTNFVFTSINDETLKEINNHRFTYASSTNLEIYDLTSIQDYSNFSKVITKVFEDTYSTDIDGVLTLDLSMLETLITNLPSDHRPIEINGVNFNQGGNLLNNLAQTQIQNENIKEKHRVLTKLLAELLNANLGMFSSNFSSVIQSLEKGSDNQALLFESDDLKFRNYIKENNINAKQTYESDFFTHITLNVEDPTAVNITKYPNVDYSLTTEIDSNYVMKQSLAMNFSSIGITQEVAVCLPLNIKSSSIVTLNNFPEERTIINSASNERCVVYKILDENSISLTWESEKLNTTNLKNLQFSIAKIPGSETTNVDFTIKLPSSIVLEQADEFTTLNNGSLFYTNRLTHDKFITLSLNVV